MNKLGICVDLEDNWETKIDRRCSGILVEMDMREGLFEEIIIVMHESVWTQILEYLNLLLWCYNS